MARSTSKTARRKQQVPTTPQEYKSRWPTHAPPVGLHPSIIHFKFCRSKNFLPIISAASFRTSLVIFSRRHQRFESTSVSVTGDHIAPRGFLVYCACGVRRL
ncbi:hypothetical protein RvY_17090 [Ramazzottius varieornatus]|uniref:Uncharacterized protein n=1 Tax=Ramazzottius varieornatus TaxID=947166 RepID=A0A1D1W0W4_RAMVA|nr:hypothetical protein RvY_17090 [Ramazzottius varieornatus]